jgi:hypothetical protein
MADWIGWAVGALVSVCTISQIGVRGVAWEKVHDSHAPLPKLAATAAVWDLMHVPGGLGGLAVRA